MTEESPKVDPKYYQASGGLPKLVPAAQKAFAGLLWAGIIGCAAGLVVMLASSVFAGVSVLQLSLPFLVGAGIVAGLGKRTE